MKLAVLTPGELEELITRAVDVALDKHNALSEVMTLESAARFLSIHPKLLAKRAASGEIPATKIGKSWRFMRSQLVEHLRSQTQGAA